MVDGSCDPAACPGKRCEAGACSAYASCKQLHDSGPLGATNGIYALGTSSSTFKAYCEMSYAEGGWTLVGQSGTTTPGARFGWTSATGSVEDPAVAYSLDAVGRGGPMAEALVATGTRGAIEAAYVLQLPAGFPVGFENRAGPTLARKVANPNCASTVAPFMFGYVGYTARTTHFFFRDNSGNFETGLFPSSWDLYYDEDCPYAGELTDERGLLFVR